MTDASRPSPYLAELETARAFDPGEAAPAGWSTDSRVAAGARPPLAGSVAGGAGRVPARRVRPGPAAPAAAVDPAREQALRSWRTERSRRDKVPPFIVLHDRTLLAVAAARPSSLVALRQIDGIGPLKLELYGEEILATLAAISE
jgi:ATP-dependent DNA helicase RecQ